MSYKNLLVEIFVDIGEEEGYIATGYPIAEGRLITARHAIFPDDKQPRRIEIRWHHQEDDAGKWQAPLDPAQCIVWEGGELFDVAVLKCPFPVEGSALLSSDKPKDGMTWASEGFAAAGKRGNKRQPVPMLGEVHSAADTEKRFALGVKYATEKPADWQGASGSPVFVNGEIIGIIESCPAHFNAERFNATPTWKLLEEASFRAAVGYEAMTTRTLWAQDKLLEILRKSASNRKILAQRLNLDCDQLYALADALLANDDAIFKSINRIFLELAKQASDDLKEWLKDILAVMLPSRLDPTLLQKLQEQKQDINCLTVAIPVASVHAAEMAMAGLDQRSMQFRIIEDPNAPENRLLKAVLAVDLPPEMGIDTDGSSFIKAFKEYLIDKTGVRKDLPLNHHVDEDELVAAVADELEYLAEEENLTHYFIYAVPDDTERKNRCTVNAKKLSESFPAMIFVNLSGTQLTQERREFRPLRKLWDID